MQTNGRRTPSFELLPVLRQGDVDGFRATPMMQDKAQSESRSDNAGITNDPA